MKRSLIGFVVALVAAGVLASPALAHEEVNPSRYKTQTPTFFQLSVANEKTSDLTKVEIDAPKGLSFGSTTRSPTGFTVDRADEKIVWSGGDIKPNDFDSFGFEIEGADKAGTYTWTVVMSFADGSSEPAVDVPGTAVDDLQAAAKPSSGKATVALVIAIVAALLALVALLRSFAGRPPAVGSKADGTDW